MTILESGISPLELRYVQAKLSLELSSEKIDTPFVPLIRRINDSRLFFTKYCCCGHLNTVLPVFRKTPCEYSTPYLVVGQTYLARPRDIDYLIFFWTKTDNRHMYVWKDVSAVIHKWSESGLKGSVTKATVAYRFGIDYDLVRNRIPKMLTEAWVMKQFKQLTAVAENIVAARTNPATR